MATKYTKKRQTADQRQKAEMIIRGSAGEPVLVQDVPEYRSTVIRALNWYNMNEDNTKFKQYAVAYCRQFHKDAVPVIQQAAEIQVKYIGIIGRLIMRGQYVSPQYIGVLNKHLAELIDTHKPAAAVDNKKRVEAKATIQDRMNELASRHIAEVESVIDEYVNVGTDFAMKDYIASNTITGPVAKRIGAAFKDTLKELRTAYSNKCPQLKEGYSHLSRTGLRRLGDFVEQVISDCEQTLVSSKMQRKPRTKKVKSPVQVAAKVQYMKEYTELGLKSVTPDKIIGATELYVYQPERRRLTVFRSVNGGELSVKGTTVINYDVSTALTKTVRDPQKFFKDLVSTGKRAMANAFKSLSGKGMKPRARLNGTMLIVATN